MLTTHDSRRICEANKHAESRSQPVSESRSDNRSAADRETVVTLPVARPLLSVRFDRQELMAILNLYGRMVAAGEWRDYAVDFLKDRAVFSVFRRASEMALYRIEKRPDLRGRQGMYCVVAAGGLVMKRGHDLAHVLRVLERPLKAVDL